MFNVGLSTEATRHSGDKIDGLQPSVPKRAKPTIIRLRIP